MYHPFEGKEHQLICVGYNLARDLYNAKGPEDYLKASVKAGVDLSAKAITNFVTHAVFGTNTTNTDYLKSLKLGCR